MADDVPRKVWRRQHPCQWFLIIAAFVPALALGLGSGPSLGLKHRHSETSTPTSALPLLAPQTSSNFVIGTIVGQSPQERTYNFAIAFANGAPDGVNKTMLVVNGAPLRSCAVIISLLPLYRPMMVMIIAGRPGTV